MLNGLLNDVVIQTIQAPADADALIVSTALSVIVVGTDTDLLVMLVHLTGTYTCYALGFGPLLVIQGNICLCYMP